MKKISLLLISILLLFINCNIKSVEKEDYIMDFKNIESMSMYDISFFDIILFQIINNYFNIENTSNETIYKNEQGKPIFKINEQDQSISIYDNVTKDDNIIISSNELIDILRNAPESEGIEIIFNYISSFNNIIIKFDGIKNNLNNSNDTITCNYSSYNSIFNSTAFCIALFTNSSENMFDTFNIINMPDNIVIQNKEGKSLVIFNEGNIIVPSNVTISDNISIMLNDEFRNTFNIPSKYKTLKMIFVENTQKIYIKSIDIVESNNAYYLVPSFNENITNLNTTLFNINDFIKYKVTIENKTNENYELNISKPTNSYFDYKIDYENDNVVKSNSTSNIYITLKYNKPVNNTNGFVEEKNIEFKLSSNKSVIDELINPETGVSRPIIIMIILLIASLSIFLIINKINKVKLFTIIIALFITIPMVINALSKFNIVINSTIKVPGEYIYSIDSKPVSIKANSKLPHNIELFVTKEDAIKNWKKIPFVYIEQPFYIKYKLDGNKNIQETYIDFVITEEMASEIEGLIPGTYSFRGGGATYEINQEGHEIYNDDSIYYEDNINILKEAFGYDTHPSRIKIYTNYTKVSFNNYNLELYKNGNVYILIKGECKIEFEKAYCTFNQRQM